MDWNLLYPALHFSRPWKWVPLLWKIQNDWADSIGSKFCLGAHGKNSAHLALVKSPRAARLAGTFSEDPMNEQMQEIQGWFALMSFEYLFSSWPSLECWNPFPPSNIAFHLQNNFTTSDKCTIYTYVCLINWISRWEMINQLRLILNWSGSPAHLLLVENLT